MSGGRKKSLRASPYCRLYMALWARWTHSLSHFEIKVPLWPVLEGAGAWAVPHTKTQSSKLSLIFFVSLACSLLSVALRSEFVRTGWRFNFSPEMCYELSRDPPITRRKLSFEDYR